MRTGYYSRVILLTSYEQHLVILVGDVLCEGVKQYLGSLIALEANFGLSKKLIQSSRLTLK